MAGQRAPIGPPTPAVASPPTEEFSASPYRDVFGVDYEIGSDEPRLLHTDLPSNAIVHLGASVDYAERLRMRKGDRFTSIRYHRSGEPAEPLHRTDGPAVIERLGDLRTRMAGGRVSESYYLDGAPGRTDGGPTEVIRREDGSVLYEKYLGPNREEHRIDGPAVILYREDGSVKSRDFKRKGTPSRIDGPVHEEFGPDGLPTHATYGLGGKRYPSAEALYSAAKLLSGGTLRRHFIGSSLEELSRGREHEVVRILAAGVRTPEGVAEVFTGAPAEWVAAYEEGDR